jgi:carbon monoxide dehydrogenase subunit G
MQLTHSFTVPTDLEQAWEVLLDIERIAPCMPGAAIETVDGDDFTGTVKVRLGPIGLTYKGKASFVEKDAVAHRAVIDALGKDARGNGTAKARITATLTAEGRDHTAVHVVTDLNITGKPAQFGRGVMVDVGNKLIGQFADCLAGKLAGAEGGGLAGAEAGSLAGAEAGGVAGAEGGGLVTAADPTELDIAKQLQAVEFDSGERLGTADPEPAEQLTSDLAEPGEVESGLAELRMAPSVTPDSSVAGPGLAAPDAGPSAPGTAAPGPSAPGEAVVALPGPAPDEQPVEPAAAAEAAAPATPAVTQRSPAHRPAVDEVEPIDLLGSAGPAVAKRLAPAAVGVLLVLLVLLRARRRAAARSAAARQARADYRAAVRRWAEAERRAAIERRNLSRTMTAGLPRPAAGSRAWPAFRTADRPAGRVRRRSE